MHTQHILLNQISCACLFMCMQLWLAMLHNVAFHFFGIFLPKNATWGQRAASAASGIPKGRSKRTH